MWVSFITDLIQVLPLVLLLTCAAVRWALHKHTLCWSSLWLVYCAAEKKQQQHYRVTDNPALNPKDGYKLWVIN